MSWRAFFILAIAAATSFAGAPPSRPPELAQVGLPDEAEAAQLISQVREAGIPGQFYLEFDLRMLPRRGPETTFKGRLWGGRNEQGNVTRLEVTDAGNTLHRFLIQNGEQRKVWRVVDGRAVVVEGKDLFAPLIPGVEVSAFDLQMPFLHWPGATVEKLTRVMGRPAHVFLFRAPPDVTAVNPDISGVRAYLDTQYNAIMQTEVLGRSGRVAKTFALVGSLKRVNEQYIPKQADYRNETTRDKTRLQITGAALNLKLPAMTFDSAQLARAVPPPPAAQIVSLTP